MGHLTSDRDQFDPLQLGYYEMHCGRCFKWMPRPETTKEDHEKLKGLTV